jgi:PKD repeat protein
MGLIRKHEIRIWIAASVTMIALLAIVATSVPHDQGDTGPHLQSAVAMDGVVIEATGPANRTSTGYEVPVNVTNHRSEAIDIKAMDIVVTTTDASKLNGKAIGPDSVAPEQTEQFLIAIDTPSEVEVFVIDLVQDGQFLRCIMPALSTVPLPEVPQVVVPVEPVDPTTNDTNPVNAAPTASFTVNPSAGSTATTFAFNAGTSQDNETAVGALQVRWDWNGDGTYDTAWSINKTATHTYPAVGTYAATVQVRDAGGLTDTASRTIVVSATNIAPTASFIVSPSSGTTQTTFNFNASASSDPDAGDTLEYRWDWTGDGTFDTTWSTTRTAQHQFDAQGTYSVTLEVRDRSLAISSASRSVIVTLADTTTPTVTGLSPGAGATNVAVDGNVQITFSEAMDKASVQAAFEMNGGTVVLGSYGWSVDSKVLTFNPNSNLQFSTSYTISIGTGAKDAAGNSMNAFTSSFTTEDAPNTAPTARFIASSESGDTTTDFQFDASSSTDTETPGSLEYRWDWNGDGVYEESWSGSKTISHTFTEPGTYTVTLQVQDPQGLTDVISMDITVSAV